MLACRIPNTGSTARDFCMLERNILSHLKLALLLSLLASSLLLHARLVPEEGSPNPGYNFPLAIVEFLAALIAIVAGIWEYFSGCSDLRNSKAFLTGVKPHFIFMSIVSGIIFGTCVVLLAMDK
ncbi:hypothetical protein CPC08DRAFT_629080 [Agrocybe pediades]|nr:hypothetical protein CPC08DRAFT_629080 [Agrocybe pediades]